MVAKVTNFKCSFCGLPSHEVPKLLSHEDKVFICIKCAELAVQIMKETENNGNNRLEIGIC